MRDSFRLRIIGPDGAVFDGDAIQISLTGAEGSLSVRPGHVPLVTTTKAGVCRVWEASNGGISEFDCGDGLLSVASDSVTLAAVSVSTKKE